MVETDGNDKIGALIEEVKHLPWISKEAVKEKIIKDNLIYDTLVSASVHSLKDPVSFRRIRLPIRSIKCDHINCIDADTFFELQYQGSDSRCTICSSIIEIGDLRVDEYFKDLLDNTHKGIESVKIFPDGTWIENDDEVEWYASDDSILVVRVKQVKRRKVIVVL